MGDGRAALTSLELASQMVDVPESADDKASEPLGYHQAERS